MLFFGILLQVVNSETSSGIVESLVQSIASQGPMSALFLLITIYLGWRLYKKEIELKEISDYIRESDKENLKTLSSVNSTLDKLLETQRNSDNVVEKSIQNTKDFVSLKIENLTTKIDNLDDKVDKLF